MHEVINSIIAKNLLEVRIWIHKVILGCGFLSSRDRLSYSYPLRVRISAFDRFSYTNHSAPQQAKIIFAIAFSWSWKNMWDIAYLFKCAFNIGFYFYLYIVNSDALGNSV